MTGSKRWADPMVGEINRVARPSVPTPMRTWREIRVSSSPLPHPASAHQSPQRVRVWMAPDQGRLLCRSGFDGGGTQVGQVAQKLGALGIDLAAAPIRAPEKTVAAADTSIISGNIMNAGLRRQPTTANRRPPPSVPTVATAVTTGRTRIIRFVCGFRDYLPGAPRQQCRRFRTRERAIVLAE